MVRRDPHRGFNMKLKCSYTEHDCFYHGQESGMHVYPIALEQAREKQLVWNLNTVCILLNSVLTAKDTRVLGWPRRILCEAVESELPSVDHE